MLVGVSVSVAVGNGVAVSAGAGVFVGSGVSVAVAVLVAVLVGVSVGCGVAVGITSIAKGGDSTSGAPLLSRTATATVYGVVVSTLAVITQLPSALTVVEATGAART